MNSHQSYSIESAPEQSKPALQDLKQAFGFIPNVAAVMAGSPVLLLAFVGLFRQVHSGTFSEAEIQILLLTNARTNRSAWAIAFHSALALQLGVAPSAVQAIREQRLPEEPKLAALSALARALIEKRGHVPEPELRAFHEAGYSQQQLLEAITVSAASTMTNYAANVGKPELESQFQAHAWSE